MSIHTMEWPFFFHIMIEDFNAMIKPEIGYLGNVEYHFSYCKRDNPKIEKSKV